MGVENTFKCFYSSPHFLFKVFKNTLKGKCLARKTEGQLSKNVWINNSPSFRGAYAMM